MSKIKTFKELEMWKKGILLVQNVYQITAGFPKEELYGLASQMQRASISIPSNIAEGFRRWHVREFRQFLNVALGSLAELETQTLIALKLGYIHSKQETSLCGLMEEISRLIVGMLKKLNAPFPVPRAPY